MINRRDTLATLVVAGLAAKLAKPSFAHHVSAPSDSDDLVLGDADAPITMIEYSSLTCSHCASFHANTLPEIKKNYIDTGKVRLVFRHFPFDQPALLAAALAECAGHDRFFNFVDVLFASQNTWARSANVLAALNSIGRLGGLKTDAIVACFADQEMLDRILSDRIEGTKQYDINSTPTFIVNGEKLVGNQPYDMFVDVFERLLPNG